MRDQVDTRWLLVSLLAVVITGCPGSKGPPTGPADTHLGGQLGGPSVPADVKSQRDWEAKYAALSKAVSAAGGNELAVKRETAALDAFVNATWKPGSTLDGWIGGVDEIRETYEKYPDPKGAKALTATVYLTDKPKYQYGAQLPKITLVNYDLSERKSTGLAPVFETLKPGQLVRVWGRLQTLPDGKELRLAVHRLETVDLPKERAALLDRGSRVIARLDTLLKQQEEVLKPQMPEGAPGPRTFGGSYSPYYSLLAKMYPAWMPAVATHNACSQVMSAEEANTIRKSLQADAERIKTERFLDDQITANLDKAEEASTQAAAKVEKAYANLKTLHDCLAKGWDELQRRGDREELERKPVKGEVIPKGFPVVVF